MGNITLSLPDTVQEEMRRFREVRWSEVARSAIVQKLEALRFANSLAQKSKLSAEDVSEFSRKIKKLASKRFLA